MCKDFEIYLFILLNKEYGLLCRILIGHLFHDKYKIFYL